MKTPAWPGFFLRFWNDTRQRCYTVYGHHNAKEGIVYTRKSWTTVGCAAALAAFAAGAPAQTPDPNASRALAATCFTCHGTEGRSVGGTPPSLAGQSRASLLQQMRDFRDGKRPATIMHQQAKGYTDQQLELIADYFSKVNAKPAASGGGSSSPAGASY
jgi:cytochrome subunit of sulfide dehydrogenase